MRAQYNTPLRMRHQGPALVFCHSKGLLNDTKPGMTASVALPYGLRAKKGMRMSKITAIKNERPQEGSNTGNAGRVNRMGTASIPKLIVEFAIPSILGMLVNGAYNVIDSIFLGQGVGEIGLTAVTVAFPAMVVMMALAMLVGNGGNALAALRLGEGRHDDAETSLGNTFTLSIIVAAAVALIVNTPAVEWLLTISSATDEARPYARTFMQIVGMGFVFQMVGMGINNFIRTAGAPFRAFMTMLIGAIACTVFNALFVLALGWGVTGSALATVAGQAVSCASVMWYFLFTKKSPLKLRVRCLKLHGPVVVKIFTLGFASFILQVGMAAVNFVVNYLLAKWGALSPIGADDAQASIGVVQRVASFVVMPLIGVAVALQPLLGYNYGAHLFDRVKKTLLYGIIGATGIGVLMWAIIHLWPTQIVGAFGITHPDLADFTVFALTVQMMMIPFVGFQIVCSNYFQATGQPAKSVFLSLTRQIIFLIPLYLALPYVLPSIFPQYTGLDAVYFAVPIADGLAILTTAAFMVHEMGRIKKLESGELQARF